MGGSSETGVFLPLFFSIWGSFYFLFLFYFIFFLVLFDLIRPPKIFWYGNTFLVLPYLVYTAVPETKRKQKQERACHRGGVFLKKNFFNKNFKGYFPFSFYKIPAIFPMWYNKSLSLSLHPPAVPPLPSPLYCLSFLPTSNHQFVLSSCESASFMLYSLVVFFRFHI